MNGQIKIDGFNDGLNLEELKALCSSLGRAVEFHEELLQKAKQAEGIDRKILNNQLLYLRDTIQDQFNTIVYSLGGEDFAEKIRVDLAAKLQDRPEAGISALKMFYIMLCMYIDSMPEGEEALQKLSEDIQQEILQILDRPKTSEMTAIEYNPFLSNAMTAAAREGREQLISFSSQKGVDRTMTRKSGSLAVYDTSVLNRVIREYRLGNVTSKNEVVFILDDFCREMNKKKGTPSAKQKQDVKESLETIRNTPFSFITSDELSAILGIEAAGMLEGFKGMKLDDPKLHETHLIDKLDMITRYKRRGKKTTAVVLTFGDTFKNMIDSFPWYEEMDSSINNIQVLKDGKLSDWTYTKERQTLQYYIHRLVFAKIRANTAGKAFSNKVNYCVMFSDCQIDITHRQQLKRKTEDVKTIFSDLQRKGFVTRFSEYDTKTEKKAGIQFYTPKFEYAEIEG